MIDLDELLVWVIFISGIYFIAFYYDVTVLGYYIRQADGLVQSHLVPSIHAFNPDKF